MSWIRFMLSSMSRIRSILSSMSSLCYTLGFDELDKLHAEFDELHNVLLSSKLTACLYCDLVRIILSMQINLLLVIFKF